MTNRTALSTASALCLALLVSPCVVHAQPASAPADDPVHVSSGTVVIGTRVVLTACASPVTARLRERLVVACADGRVRAYAASDASLLDDRRSASPVTAIFDVGGEPWVLVDGQASALSSLPAAPPPPPAASPAPTEAPTPTSTLVVPPPSAAQIVVAPPPDRDAPPARSTRRVELGHRPVITGEVLSVHGTRAVISIGRSGGLVQDDRMEVLPLEAQADELGASPVVGRVVALADGRAEIEVGFGEIVPVGATVRSTDHGATRVLTDPSPHRSFVALDIGARAWIDAAGIGTLDELGLTYRADIPLAVRARLFPFAALYVGPTTDQPAEGGGVVAGGAVEAMFDHRYFSLGVGVGFGSYVSSRIIRPAPGVVANDTQRVGFSLLPSLRLGPVDGLHLSVQFSALAVIDEFRFGGATIDGQIPLVPGFWLTPRGGYSISGLGYAELGLRVAVDGNGGAGTLFVIPSLGWAGMDTGNHGFRSGPTVGVTLETRFGV